MRFKFSSNSSIWLSHFIFFFPPNLSNGIISHFWEPKWTSHCSACGGALGFYFHAKSVPFFCCWFETIEDELLCSLPGGTSWVIVSLRSVTVIWKVQEIASLRGQRGRKIKVQILRNVVSEQRIRFQQIFIPLYLIFSCDLQRSSSTLPLNLWLHSLEA